MARQREIVLNKEELIEKIKALHQEHQDEPKCRSLVTQTLNQEGTRTLTGMKWNASRLSQFIRANIPELIDKPKVAAETAKPNVPRKEAAGPTSLDVQEVVRVQIGDLKEEIRGQIGERIELATKASEEALDRMVRQLATALESNLHHDLQALTHETGKLLNQEIAMASKDYEERLESKMAQLKAELNGTLEDFKTEMRSVVKDEVHKALTEPEHGCGRSESEAPADLQPRTAGEMSQKQDNPPDTQPAYAVATQSTPMELTPAFRLAEFMESGFVWWMKAIFRPKQ